MSTGRLFKRGDQDFTPKEGRTAAVLAMVNAGNSTTMGGGLGVFRAGTDVDWTVTYDEFLFIHEGEIQLKIRDQIYDAGPGDTLWIPADTPLSYIAERDVWFFFSVYPAVNSPSASQAIDYPEAPPRPA